MAEGETASIASPGSSRAGGHRPLGIFGKARAKSSLPAVVVPSRETGSISIQNRMPSP